MTSWWPCRIPCRWEAPPELAGLLVQTFQGIPPVYLLAVILTQLIENAAVAIILAPIAYLVVIVSGVDPKPFMVGLAICVSSSFCTPVAMKAPSLFLVRAAIVFVIICNSAVSWQC